MQGWNSKNAKPNLQKLLEESAVHQLSLAKHTSPLHCQTCSDEGRLDQGLGINWSRCSNVLKATWTRTPKVDHYQRLVYLPILVSSHEYPHPCGPRWLSTLCCLVLGQIFRGLISGITATCTKASGQLPNLLQKFLFKRNITLEKWDALPVSQLSKGWMW